MVFQKMHFFIQSRMYVFIYWGSLLFFLHLFSLLLFFFLIKMKHSIYTVHLFAFHLTAKRLWYSALDSFVRHFRENKRRKLDWRYCMIWLECAPQMQLNIHIIAIFVQGIRTNSLSQMKNLNYDLYSFLFFWISYFIMTIT